MMRLFIAVLCSLRPSHGFTVHSTRSAKRCISIDSPCRRDLRAADHASFLYIPRGGATSTQVSLVGPAAASVLAGSVAGAIGVGVAFPLDTLKTKAQLLGPEASGMIQTIRLIWNTEGLGGFFGGVKGMMLGQALIKALAFSFNTLGISLLSLYYPQLSQTLILLIAACTAGALTSFAVAPIERVKVMMQASNTYKNEWECIEAILRTEGFMGLLGRGLGPTLAREIPSYGLYFYTYGLLSQTFNIGPLSPMVFGALSGMACWIPVYPIDSVKTLVQNTAGEEGHVSSWSVCRKLYNEGGIGAFFDGLTPKLLRAAVNHAVTFAIYDAIMQSLMPPAA
ncbi:hypothetical protein MPSEU_001001300 [Mayamaea pseudoterrestris]|nr:hypothetical protein MPSEU_001001300 [Mayamaea pseudoterrestris]